MDSAVALNKTKRDYFLYYRKLLRTVDTVYIFHSANSLTLDTVCIKNRVSR